MSGDRKPIAKDGTAIGQNWFSTRVWVLLPLLATVALVAAILVASSVSASDGVVYYDGPEDGARLAAFVAANPGKDVIVLPAEGVPPLSGDERRSEDEARAAAQDDRRNETVSEPQVLACMEEVRSDLFLPGRFVSCGGEVLSLPSAVSAPPAFSVQAKRERIASGVRELLAGVTPGEKELGFSSPFSRPDALHSVLMKGGDVVLDFNDTIALDVGSLHPGSATHAMLEQLLRTVFQFEEVQTVALTLDGSCEEMAALYENSCFTWDRPLWDQQNALNGVVVNSVSLEGGTK